ncbi:hypothetical protein HanRHA438_Chr10g0463881 [Helianthus annuus]|nr:hypothetical protein HanRHA438_Chr10g0463881 [Helianthus annuus]
MVGRWAVGVSGAVTTSQGFCGGDVGKDLNEDITGAILISL